MAEFLQTESGGCEVRTVLVEANNIDEESKADPSLKRLPCDLQHFAKKSACYKYCHRLDQQLTEAGFVTKLAAYHHGIVDGDALCGLSIFPFSLSEEEQFLSRESVIPEGSTNKGLYAYWRGVRNIIEDAQGAENWLFI